MKKATVYAFIDSQNLNLGVKSQGWELDFTRFRVFLKDKYHVEKAFLFIGFIEANQLLYDSLRKAGYTCIFKPTIRTSKHKKIKVKGNVDAELVLHTMIEYKNYTKAMIVSGDGDFHCLIEYLEGKKKLLKVIVPNQKYSSLLRRFRGFIVHVDDFRSKVEKNKKREGLTFGRTLGVPSHRDIYFITKMKHFVKLVIPAKAGIQKITGSRVKPGMTRLISVLLIFSLLLPHFSYLISPTYAATSPWTQTDWSDSATFDSSSNVVTSTAGQVTLTNTEELSNTDFETNLTGWDTTTSFSDTNFAAESRAIAAWPLDETTTTQSYSRAVHPADTEGRDIVINGGFDSDATWSKGTGWTISGGVGIATAAANGIGITQTLPIVGGKAYQITYTISNYSSGAARGMIGGTQGTSRTANGTYSEILIAGTSSTGIISFGTSTLNIDDVSIIQLNIPSSQTTATNLLTDGTMEAADTSSWTAVANATLSKQTTSPYAGSQLLRVARNGTNNPQAMQTILTVGTVYRAYGYVRSDGSAAPTLRDNSSGYFTGTTSTSWQPFDVVFVALGTNLILQCTTSTGTQYCEFDNITVSADTSIRAGELLQDGNMEASGTGSWIRQNGATLTKDTTSPHGGTQNIRIAYTSFANAEAYQRVFVVGKRYRVTGYVRGDGTYYMAVLNNGPLFSGTPSTSWQFFDVTFVATSPDLILRTSTSSAGYAEADDISITEVSPLVGKPTNGVVLGTSSGAGGHGTTAYSFDGTNDVVNIYSSDLNSVFNPSEGTLVAWAKVSGAGVWTDGTARRIAIIGVNGINNYVLLDRDGTNNLVRLIYAAGGTSSIVTRYCAWWQY